MITVISKLIPFSLRILPIALSSISPCINNGTLNLPEGVVLPAKDFAGNPRIAGSQIDIGAYEYQADGVQEDDSIPAVQEFRCFPNPFKSANPVSNRSTKIG